MNPNLIAFTWDRKTRFQIKTDIPIPVSNISSDDIKGTKKILIYGDNKEGLKLINGEVSCE